MNADRLLMHSLITFEIVVAGIGPSTKARDPEPVETTMLAPLAASLCEAWECATLTQSVAHRCLTSPTGRRLQCCVHKMSTMPTSNLRPFGEAPNGAREARVRSPD